jgi:F0F1-type ATP synthase membrane subunit b/b'
VKYQLTCPKCKHEFAYDSDYYEKNITRLGLEIAEIIKQLADHRRLPWSEQKARTDWFFRAKNSLAEKQVELAELKAIRKHADQQIDKMMFRIFKDLVREEIGEEAYKRLIEKSKAELEAYKISGMMRHEYTRSNAKANVTNINKL